MKALLREPLVHFLVLGGLVFALFAAIDDTPAPVPADRIEVTADDALRIARQFEATWRRQPTATELASLIDRAIEEDVLVREAQALGLDRDDPVVRQRLAQKMTFLTESGAEAVEPDDAALQAHLEAHPERFAEPGTVAFEQVFLGGAGAGEAETVLTALEGGASPDAVGAPSLLPPAIRPSPAVAVDNAFGRGFFDAVAALPVGRWAGPVESAYGLHLVRVSTVEPERLPPLAEVRELVEADWRDGLRRRLAAERLEALVARYEVVRPDPAAVLAR